MDRTEILRLAGRIFRVSIPVLLASCAGQAPPPGGPEDRIPPEIISSSPAPYATYYTERMIVLEFSEYVDRRSLEGAIFISPNVGALEFDWSGREVEITFADSLRPKTTYVVTVGTDVVDLRNRNRMASAVSLAFSSGSEIDPGAITGVVYPESKNAAKSGVLVTAYRLDGLDADTLNPRWTKPDYATQTGEAGEFALRHLRLGRYRLLALRDEYGNLLYDPQTDAFGLLDADVALTDSDTIVTELSMKLAVEDTSAPTLLKVTGRTLRMLEVEFSEPIQEAAIAPDDVQVRDTLSGSVLEVLAMTVRHPRRDAYLLATAVQDTQAVYRLTVTGVRDSAGNRISPIANSLTFVPKPDPDTTGFRLSGLSLRDSSRSIETTPTVEFSFTRPARRALPPGAVSLSDTLGRVVPVDLSWIGSLTLSARPIRSLSHEAWYVITLREGAFTDVFGERGRDTTVARSFQVISADRIGSIEGSVADENPADAKGPIVVLAQPVDGSGQSSVRQTVSGPGPFALSEVPEGRYRIGGFRDRNANGLFDPGTVFPYAPSERYRLGADTLRVRARWPYEGALIRLR